MTHHGPSIAKKGGLEVVLCDSCGYAHLQPLPTPEAVADYYGREDEEYGNRAGRDWLAKETAEVSGGLWDPAWQWQRSLLNDGALLDVGAGAGHFVAWWMENVGAAWGVEPSWTARKVQAGRPAVSRVLFSSLDDLRPHLTFVPLANVRLSLVLEHVIDPLALLAEYVALLRPGGRVMAIVPNEFNPWQLRAVRRRGDWFVDGRHLNYFDGPSLTRLFHRAGLRVRFTGATCPTEWWPVRFGPQFHKGRLLIEKAIGPRMFGLYTGLYHRWGVGREIVMVGEK